MPVGTPILYDSSVFPALPRSFTNGPQNSFTDCLPGQLAFFDFVEFFFQARRKTVSKMSSKAFTSSSVTFSPSSVGVKRP